jgi:hypothetical protein
MISAKEARIFAESAINMREKAERDRIEKLIIDASSGGMTEVMLPQGDFEFELTSELLQRLGYEITYVESTIGCLGLGCSARICISWGSPEEESEDTDND